MLGLQGVVPHHAEAGHGDGADGEPAFQLVMAGAVKDVGNANGRRGPSHLEAGKPRGIVNHVVREQDFLPSSGLEVAGGSIVEAAESADAGEKQHIGAVPKAM